MDTPYFDKTIKDGIKLELLEILKKIDWNLDYGQVKLQIRNGEVTLIAIERTIRVD